MIGAREDTFELALALPGAGVNLSDLQIAVRIQQILAGEVGRMPFIYHELFRKRVKHASDTYCVVFGVDTTIIGLGDLLLIDEDIHCVKKRRLP